MAAFRLLLCFLFSTICFCSLINAAAVQNLIYGDEFPNELGDRSEIYVAPSDHSVRSRRSVDSEFQSSSSKVCHSTTPCGWAVYVPFTRRVDYFMKNTCSCPESFKCIRTDDDLSVSAYVYRCRTNVTATDIESPTYK